MSEWRDIKTAPKGRDLLVFRPGLTSSIAIRRPEYWCGPECCPSARPTHWMPLPDPPTADRLPRAEDGTPIHPAPDQDPR